jgi:hypothetical protein
MKWMFKVLVWVGDGSGDFIGVAGLNKDVLLYEGDVDLIKDCISEEDWS